MGKACLNYFMKYRTKSRKKRNVIVVCDLEEAECVGSE